MKKQSLFLLMFSILLILSACSKDEGEQTNQGSVDDGEAAGGYGSIDHGVNEKGVGFNMAGGSIEEAQDIPAAEKATILDTFQAYIDAFNHKDIDAYISVLSPNSESFSIEDERALLEDTFKEYNVTREASDVTIVKYDENEAQLFAKLKTTFKQIESGLETKPTGRQVTVFHKTDGQWKVDSIYYIGDEEQK
ncbi:ketosteroid isomerase-like protein [Sporosarcina luteola]|nr:ketosteroid isomerase-like protein [Sporosarcina luteola]